MKRSNLFETLLLARNMGEVDRISLRVASNRLRELSRRDEQKDDIRDEGRETSRQYH